MEKKLLLDHLLAAYREVAPLAGVGGTFLITKLAHALYARGGRIVVGGSVQLIERTIHQSLDPDQRLVWTCKDWNRTLGYRAGSVVGRHISEFLTPDSVQFMNETAWPALLKDGKVGPVAVTLIAHDGTTIPALARSEILRDSEGAFQRTFAKLRCQLMRTA